MGRFYKTSSANPMDYMDSLNIPLMEKVIETNDKFIDQNLAQTDAVGALAAQLKGLNPDSEEAQKIIKEHQGRAEGIAKAIQQDPTNWRNQTDKIREASNLLKEDFTNGKASKIQGNYNAYMSWKEKLDKDVELFRTSGGDKGTNPLRATKEQADYINKFKEKGGTNYKSAGDYNPIELGEVLPDMDLAKITEEGMKGLIESGTITESTTHRGLYDVHGIEEHTGVSRERALSIGYNQLMKQNPLINPYLSRLQDLGMISGFKQTEDAQDGSYKKGDMIQPLIPKYNKDGSLDTYHSLNPKSYMSSFLSTAMDKFANSKTKSSSKETENAFAVIAQKHSNDKEMDAIKALRDQSKNDRDFEFKVRNSNLSVEEQDKLLAKDKSVGGFLNSALTSFEPLEVEKMSTDYTNLTNRKQKGEKFTDEENVQYMNLQKTFGSIAKTLNITENQVRDLAKFNTGEMFGTTQETINKAHESSYDIMHYTPKYKEVKALSEKIIAQQKTNKNNVSTLGDALSMGTKNAVLEYLPGRDDKFTEGVVNTFLGATGANVMLFKGDENILDINGKLKVKSNYKGSINTPFGGESDEDAANNPIQWFMKNNPNTKPTDFLEPGWTTRQEAGHLVVTGKVSPRIVKHWLTTNTGTLGGDLTNNKVQFVVQNIDPTQIANEYKKNPLFNSANGFRYLSKIDPKINSIDHAVNLAVSSRLTQVGQSSKILDKDVMVVGKEDNPTFAIFHNGRWETQATITVQGKPVVIDLNTPDNLKTVLYQLNN